MLAPITPRKRRRVEESVAAGVLYPWRLIVPNPIRRNSQNWGGWQNKSAVCDRRPPAPRPECLINAAYVNQQAATGRWAAGLHGQACGPRTRAARAPHQVSPGFWTHCRMETTDSFQRLTKIPANAGPAQQLCPIYKRPTPLESIRWTIFRCSGCKPT